ncbi:MAG TPA: hypothetical protein VGE13_01000 [Candidatus Saccharimonadales bacterium]
MTIQERKRPSSSVTLQQRAIARILREGMDMISDGESLTHQPDKPLNSTSNRWVENGTAARCLSLIMNCDTPGSKAEVAYLEDDDTPTFIVYKGRR